ncbi:RluA family pseudouridine synthase [Lactococcus petauri]|jgi:23S rRNA pseudouridine1911/1915/1917 synthase|uniref:RluA family pseudouridine synthase n=1 Tax=Lactococcus petauri TaxID=1940789 RepID=UPI00254F7B16|nr:RluA family pseudouridine synthase [Lactococcus petauri]
MKFSLILPKKIKKQSVSHLLEHTWLVPRKQRHLLRTKKHVFLNGTLADWEDSIKPQDEVTLIFDDDDFRQLEVPVGNPHLADILYEDEHLVIVNKPEGMKTHGNTAEEIALQNHVTARLKSPVHVVHRLDKETSGAVLFAKNQLILPILGKMFEENKIHRSYLAVVQGYFNEKSLTLNKNIGRDRHDRKKYATSKNGKRAITHVTVLEKEHNHSLVRCTLDTGRTHQIRVHLSSERHPIVGDPLYNLALKNQRLMLHAEKIYFLHPFTEELIEIKASSQTFQQGKKSLLSKSRP